MENLNAEQIKGDLECCAYGDCKDCTEYSNDSCGTKVLGGALELIKSQEQRIKELTEENERLRGILLQFTDIVHKWGNKNGYDTSEIALVPILNEANTIKSQIEADTVRKMQELIYERLDISVEGYSSEEIKSDVRDMVDRIATEMLEGK